MRIRSLLAVIAVAALFVTACSSDDGSLEDVASEAQTESTDQDSDSSDSDSDSGDTDSADSDSGDSSDIDDAADAIDELDTFLDGDCLEFSLAYGTLFLGALGAFGGEEDVEEIQDELGQLDASVPSEIAEEFEIVSEAYAEYFGEISEFGFLSPEASEIEDPLDDPEVAEADQAINDWLEENCS